LPRRWHFQRQREAGFQVGLVEAGERQLRPGGNKKGVEKFVVAIERFVSAEKLDIDLVGSGSRLRRRNHQVTVDDTCRGFATVDGDTRDAIGRLREIENDPVRRLQGESGADSAAHRLLPLLRHGELEVVTKFMDGGTPFGRERLGNARIDRGSCSRLHQCQCRSGQQRKQHHTGKKTRCTNQYVPAAMTTIEPANATR